MNIAILNNALNSPTIPKNHVINYIDLFAGMGGTRLGFEQALRDNGLIGKCVFTSELKDHAINAYKQNFDNDEVYGDITKINPLHIPDFEFLLAGFPCQPFSSAGRRNGFLDERGGLFFTIHNILRVKKPDGFLLENVDALVTHDNGKTLQTILKKLEDLNYKVNFAILDSSEFGIPQIRKRIYIVGHNNQKPTFPKHKIVRTIAKQFIDYEVKFDESDFSKTLKSKFSGSFLEGKSIKDKRGGDNNIHSWDLEIKGPVNQRQKKLLSEILKKRRSKKWAKNKGIKWMDGMPLTLSEIRTFRDYKKLETDLEYLSKCGYLKFEHPKKLVQINGINKRVYNEDSEKGYNIVAGKLSFPFAKILNPNDFVPTIVATEVGKIAVSTYQGVRSITVREGLNFSGFPSSYKLDNISYKDAFDLLGNTVMPPVIRHISNILIKVHLSYASQ